MNLKLFYLIFIALNNSFADLNYFNFAFVCVKNGN